MKFIIPILLCFFSQTMNGELLKDGMVWNIIASGTLSHPDVEHFQLKVLRDTIIYGRTCKVVGAVSNGEVYFNYILRENHGIIYRQDDTNEGLPLCPIMNFNLKKGDAFQDYYDEEGYVVDIDSIVIDGKKHKRVSVSPCSNDNIDTSTHWIEDVGADSEFFITPIVEPIGRTCYLVSAYLNDECIYENDNLPDWATNALCEPVKTYDGDREKIYSLSGVELNKVPKKGICILGNKKIAY